MSYCTSRSHAGAATECTRANVGVHSLQQCRENRCGRSESDVSVAVRVPIFDNFLDGGVEILIEESETLFAFTVEYVVEVRLGAKQFRKTLLLVP